MIKANFNTYASYVTDSLYQWDLNQVLSVSGLNLAVVPEVHFSNANTDRAIVRQATMIDHVVSVAIPNSLLQDPLTIHAHIGIYEGDTFKIVERVDIPVIPKKRPSDYRIETADEEIYSFQALENAIANMVKVSDFNATNATLAARIDNIIVHNNDTEGNSELVDIRTDINGKVHGSAGAAVRDQVGVVANDSKQLETEGFTTFFKYAKWILGGMNSAQWVNMRNRIMSDNVLLFDRDIVIKIADGFRVGFHTLDKNGAFLADSGWQQNSFNVRAGTPFKMVVSRITETAAEIASISEFSNAVTFNSYIHYRLENLDKLTNVYAETLRAFSSEIISPTGYRYTSNHNPPDNNRIHAADIVCNSCLVITAHDRDPGYYYGVDLYTNDGNRTFISASGWMKMSERPNYVVSRNCIVDIVIAKINDSGFSDLSEMDGLIEVVVYDKISTIERDLAVVNKHKKNWLTSAHRGFVDSVLKENTLAAFYNAYLNGADMIEADARLTSDGVLICNHDPTATGIDPLSGKTVTYTVADTDSETLCSLILSDEATWGTQTIPTLDRVLNLAYHTGLIVNIDMKNGAKSVDAILNSVLKNGMRGRIIYALNGSGITTINKIMEKDPAARFIDIPSNFTAEKLADLQDYERRCFAYTSDFSDTTIASIRASGCMLALIGLSPSNFEAAIKYHPEMCEYLHTSNFRTIESNYFDKLKLY